MASICPTMVFTSSDLSLCPFAADSLKPFLFSNELDSVAFASWPGLRPCRQPCGVAQPNSLGMFLGRFRSSRSTHTPEKWYRYRPRPKQEQARLNACASALVHALS